MQLGVVKLQHPVIRYGHRYVVQIDQDIYAIWVLKHGIPEDIKQMLVLVKMDQPRQCGVAEEIDGCEVGGHTIGLHCDEL